MSSVNPSSLLPEDSLVDNRQIYFNRPQLDAILIDANESYHVWGRGTGKTSRLLTRKYQRNMLAMPRSAGFLVHRTYTGLLTRVLPSFIAGLESLGWVKGVDYEVGRRMDGVPEPFEPPVKDYKYFIHCRNGSGVHLISQDMKGSSNGLNTDYGGGDEAKYLNYEQFTEETMPTMRAHRHRFQHLPMWQSLTFTTSMPTTAESKWILEMEKRMQKDRIENIRMLVGKILELEREKQTYSANSSNWIRVDQYIRKLNEVADFHRIGDREKDDPTIYFSRASSLENIAVLGEGYIRKMKRNLPDFTFRTEILNEEISKVEGGFYAKLDMNRHTYDPISNNSKLQEYDYDFEKLKEENLTSIIDLDVDRDTPIRITIDWGVNISCMVLAQRLPNELRFIKNMWVKHPELIQELVNKFVSYYQPHQNKEVYYYYYSSETPRQMNSLMNYAEDFADQLRKKGWKVTLVNLGTQPLQHDRYLKNHQWFSSNFDGVPFRFNRYNCKEALTSMMMAPAKENHKGLIEKVKRSEKNKSIPQEEATHFSDAVDTHLDVEYNKSVILTADFLPMM